MPKRLGRIVFYLTARTATRVFPATFADYLERAAPKPWGWLSKYDRAYVAAANSAPVIPDLVEHVTERYVSRFLSNSSHLTSDRRTHTVHQFHSGSSTGDAITNAMFLIQHRLRGLGFASEIYVEHRHPDLTDRLFEMADLPQHDDYVLIVHHSMGYDACEQIIELPARKILIYHNITPPEYLDDLPGMIPYAELGRSQLSLLRPHMAAAFADSEFNALELRTYGYEAPMTCPLLFDVDLLIATAKRGEMRPDQAPYTILFVGRVMASKGQADLVDAFARFRSDLAAPCRLVLVGRAAAPDAHYPKEVRRRVAQYRLENEVIVTGQVSDDQLHEWYRTAVGGGDGT
jgi:glycosyltransferase involved in cell wall biosynthesis